MNQLEEICARKRVEVLERQSKHSTADLEKLAKTQSKPRGFEGAQETSEEWSRSYS